MALAAAAAVRDGAPMTADIVVNPELRGSAVLSGLPPQRYSFGHTSADLVCSRTSVFVCTMTGVSSTNSTHKTTRSTLESRLAGAGVSRRGDGPASSTGSASASAQQHAALLVICDCTEPALEALSYVNELALAKGVQLFMVWNPTEAAALLLSFAQSATHAANAVARPQRAQTAASVMVDCLATSQVLNQLDAVRLVDRFDTPAQVFAATLHDLQSLPQVGAARSKRMHDILHAEFPTTRTRLHEVPLTPINSTSNAMVDLTGPSSHGLAAEPHRPKLKPPSQGRAAVAPVPGREPEEPSTTANASRTFLRPRASNGFVSREPPSAVAEALARRRAQESESSQSDDDGRGANPFGVRQE